MAGLNLPRNLLGGVLNTVSDMAHTVKTLADAGVNVVDVATHLVAEEGEQPIYAMMMEVELPPDVAADRLEAELRQVAERERLDLSVRAVEAEAL